MHGGWGKVVLTGDDGPYHHPPLGGELITMLPQGGGYFFLSEPHFNL
jgi:hypothetical protein